MAKVKAPTTKTTIVKVKKKTTTGDGKFSKLPTRKGSTKKAYRGQGK